MLDGKTTLNILKEMLYKVWRLKSNEDMILALTGQFKQLSHEPGKFQVTAGFETTTSAMPVQCSYQLSYEVVGSNPAKSPENFQVHETIA